MLLSTMIRKNITAAAVHIHRFCLNAVEVGNGKRKKEKGKTGGSADGSELEIWQFLLSAALMLHRNELGQADACCVSRSLSPVAVSQVLSVSFSLNGASKRASELVAQQG